jgi:hypothetical protein
MMSSKEEPKRTSIPWPSYLRDLMGLYTEMARVRSERAQRAFERMAAGEYGADDWAKEAGWWWGQWVRDAFQIFDSFQRSATGDAVPTGVFILDDDAENCDPKELPLATRLHKGDRPVPTSLTRQDADGLPIPASWITVRPDETMDRLFVSFRGIASIPEGHYLGWVYADEPGSKVPLAAIHLVKLAGRGRSAATRRV